MKQTKKPFIGKVAASLAAALLCAGLFVAVPVKAETATPGALPTTTAPFSGTSFATTSTSGSRYAPPPTQETINNRVQTAYTNNKVCFITQDPAYAPDSKSGPVAATANVVYDNNKYANVPVVYLAGGNYSYATMKPVVTSYDALFFGGGVFTDTDTLDAATQKNTHTLFSKEGLCIIGAQLSPSDNGQPTVFKRASNVRYHFTNPNIFIDGVVFDGNGKALANNKSNGYYCISIADGNNAGGFYMRNCTIQNIAAQALVPGVAINADAPGGQVNLEKITVNNVASGSGYANVQLNDCSNMNIRDMTVILSQGSASPAIAIEQSGAQQPNVSFSGYVNVSRAGAARHAGEGQKYIAAENYNAGTLTLPDNYPYAVFYTNGTVRLYQDKADIDYTGGALFDAKDQCWLVDQGTPGHEDQLAAISTVLQDMNQNRQPGPDGSPQYASDAFIKILPDASGILKGFAIPDFNTAKAHIRALTSGDASFVSSLSATGGMVPFSGDASEKIEFPASGAANVTLYGVDFDKNGHRTLQEVLQGGTADTRAPVAVGASKDSFVQCAFTGLAASLVIISSPTSLQVNTTGHAQAKIDSVYLANGYTLPADGAVRPNDASLEWTSSDPRVATVDDTGSIRALAAGAVIITAKAKDAYNQGEIAKPSASFRLTVTTAPVSTAASPVAPPSSSTPASGPSSAKAPSSVAASSSSSSAPASAVISSSAAASSASGGSASTVLADDSDAPSSGLRGPKWALANLILALGSIVIALLVFIQYAFGRREDESVLEETASPETKAKNGGIALRIAILAAALLSVVLFILTESLRLPIAFVDRWTPAMLLFPLVQLVLILLLRKTDSSMNGSDTQGTDLYE